MKDLFSGHAADYALYRPSYTDELVDFIAGFCNQKKCALDVATGNGQLAVKLAERFAKVYATDLSEKQLQNATLAHTIYYSVQTAEELTIIGQEFDLITVAQAAHWIDIERFVERIKLHAHSETVVAFIGYNLVQLEAGLQENLEQLYAGTLKDCWKPERKLVDNNLKDLYFPFSELAATATFSQQLQWNKHQFIGYLNTWSGVKTFEAKYGFNPVEKHFDIEQLPDQIAVTFPFYYRLGKLV